ncbi:hypothetical protein [Thermaurantiacus sp.]|uniref:hypothetical protein n=1 Tax=Thermaurantiacus sp. TaxID=2820283 RepID=UPI00298F1510|nr:hypothetical protein [Thermaurantiacus sp.]
MLSGLLGAGSGAGAQGQPRVLVADPEPVVQATVRNAALKVRVALGFPAVLLLNADAARAAGLKPVPLVGKFSFSSPLVPGGRAVFRFNLVRVGLDGAPRRRLPTVWIDPHVTARTDGVVSIFAFEGERILWERPTARRAGETYEILRDGRDDPEAWVRLGGERIRVTLAPDAPVTIMNARAARALEAEGLVRRMPAVGLWEPIPGARLPYQRLRPAPGARLLGLPLARPAARIGEAEARAIDAAAEAGTSTAEDDADTIVVRGERGGGRRGREPWLLIGADVLDQCWRIELDRPAKVWRLTCAFEGGA